MPLSADPPATPPAAVAWSISRKALVLLTVAVIGVHGWLLQALPNSLGLDGAAKVAAAPAAMVFNTRRVEVEPAKAAAAVALAPQVTAVKPTSKSAASPPNAADTKSTTAPEAARTLPTTKAEAAQPAALPAQAETEPAAEQSAHEKSPPSAQAGHNGHALVVPGSVRLNYDIAGQARGIHYMAQGTLTWAQAQGHYDARLQVSVFLLGSRSLSSTGTVTADGLVPQRFSDKARSELAAHFLPDQHRITFSANTPDATWQRGAQDRLSMFLQLAGLMAGDPTKATAGTQVPLYVVGPRDAEEWVFNVGPTQTLTLPTGATPAVYLLRQPRREYDQKVEIWLAPQLGYLPVRIKQTQPNGDFVDQQLASSSPLP